MNNRPLRSTVLAIGALLLIAGAAFASLNSGPAEPPGSQGGGSSGSPVASGSPDATASPSPGELLGGPASPSASPEADDDEDDDKSGPGNSNGEDDDDAFESPEPSESPDDD